MLMDLWGLEREAYGSKALTDFLTDGLGTTLSSGEVGREEEGEGVVGELHVDCLCVVLCGWIGLFVVRLK